MSGDVINLRQARKRKQRDERATQADENRRRFGLSKPEKQAIKLEQTRLADTVENHKLTGRTSMPPDDTGGNG